MISVTFMKMALYVTKRVIQFITVLIPTFAFSMEVKGVYKQNPIQVHVQDIRPYAYIDGVEVVGPIMDSLRIIEKHIHHSFNVILTPRKRILKDLDMKHANLIVALDGTKFESVEEVSTLFDFNVAVIMRSDKSFDEIKRNSKACIAVIRGTHMGIETVNHNARYMEVRNYEQALKLLKKSRVDAVMGVQDELGTTIALLDSKNKYSVGSTHIVDSVSVKIYVPNEFKSKPYVKAFKKAVDAMKRDGTFARLYH